MIIAEKNGITAKFSEASWKLCHKGWTEVKKPLNPIPPEVAALLEAKAITTEVTLPEAVTQPEVVEVKSTKPKLPDVVDMDRPELIAELIALGEAVDRKWNNTTLRKVLRDTRKKKQ